MQVNEITTSAMEKNKRPQFLNAFGKDTMTVNALSSVKNVFIFEVLSYLRAHLKQEHFLRPSRSLRSPVVPRKLPQPKCQR